MEAITTMPLSLAFMCAAACHKRNGGKFSGQTYEARDKLRAIANKNKKNAG